MTLDENLSAGLADRYRQLQELVGTFRHPLVAYSGGVDSTLLLKVALDTLGPDYVVAVLGTGCLQPQAESDGAMRLADELGVGIEILIRRELDVSGVAANAPDRCYHCKKDLFEHLAVLARRRHCDAILVGSNLDDDGDYRPGRRAEAEYNVRAPLREVGLTKADVRALSRHLGLPNWDKPAYACLATRVAYELGLTPERLGQVEQAERYLRDRGLTELRVRHHGNLARIEVPPDQMAGLVESQRQELVEHFKGLGFVYVTLDLAGLRSGSQNEAIDTP